MDKRAYADQLHALLPSGPALPRDRNTTLDGVLLGLAGSLARVDARAYVLIEESDPRTAFETLPEWEADYGLPDPCSGPAANLALRRAQLVAKVIERHGQSDADYISIAAALGFTITITHSFAVAVCGVSECGDALNGDDWAHVWAVNASNAVVFWAECGDSECGDTISTFGDTVLECVIRRRNRPSKTVLFFYS